MTEADLMRKILIALCEKYGQRGLFYRRNVGAVRTETGFVRFGLPGQADIAGILEGRAIEIEVKTAKGKQSAEQRNWQLAVQRAGGVYILARDVTGCLNEIGKAIRNENG